ncbi:tigger transposable element-derived protein 1-like [Amblyraja radiata]|uniref:tigger transposable element-derived protein 1-like n=1 Tax=Amblyraja radiata TaxID=386614 RepID=UPI0014025EBB|nr:tigger transposable element-derived protein 1-like [Amblyraja radiata]XP_032906814.1 tigger transposable element-derived protein 1-like [Amblyraja radiata]
MSKRRPVGLRGKPKRPRKGISLDVKLDILRRFDAGEKLSAIARTLVLAKSTVGTIRDSRDKIKAIAKVAAPVSARTLFLRRSEVMLSMERLLSLWIEDQAERKVPLSSMVIQAKAKRLYNNLVKEKDSGARVKPFLASKSWFDRFCKRFNLHNIKVSGNLVGTDFGAVRNSPSVLKKVIDEDGYLPGQVFNVEETSLYWKRLPDRTFISQDEKTAGSLNASKDRLTLLMGGNAAGDFKLKPVLVYGCESPRALSGYAKPSLPVIWRSNRKAWMTMSIFHDWFINHFCPAVERYCAQRNIPNKALLILKNGPSRPLNLNDLSSTVRVEYLPKETAALYQPMEQGVIANFKRYYLRRTLQQLVCATDGESKPTVRELLDKFNIMSAMDNIAEAWGEMEASTMNGAWKHVWPGCTNNTSLPPAETVEKITRDIVALANEAGFHNVVEGDVIQLLDSHQEDLSDEDLVWLEQERASEAVDDTDSPPAPLQLTTDHLSDALTYIDQVVDILSVNDPNRERSLKVGRLLQDAVSCYKDLYKEKIRRQQQITLDTLLVCKTEPPSPPV